MTATPDVVVPPPLLAHWRTWTGATDEQLARLGSDPGRITVVGSAGREQPGWDGAVHGVTGVACPDDSAVVSVPPAYVDWARDYVDRGASLDQLRAALPGAMGLPSHVVYRGVLRWAVDVPSAADLPDAGEWLPSDHPAVPGWLHPFGGDVLVVLEDEAYVAGLGLKRHDEHGREISVGTEEAARGKGLARRLVARAARELLAAGIVPTYLHDPANTASGKVADAAGFPDNGWTVLGLFGPVGPEREAGER
jgi:GNAT superfamily N-acetyltransferase